MENHRYCVIMAGGIGSRFWPMSTQKFPKQFQDIVGTGRTMIQQTYDRISQIIPAENIFVITNKEYVALTQGQLPDIPQDNIVGEPMMKNTGACNMYMAQKIYEKDRDATLIVLPADHLILREKNFLDKTDFAFSVAEKNEFLITLGIQPMRPDTGYGYIQYENSGVECCKVKNFTEKPNLEIAKSFLESGDFLWNAGIFVWKAETILKAFEKYLPEMHNQFQSCEFNANSEKSCVEKIYPIVEKVSIDNGILEKADNVYVIPADLGWSDLGTWTSVYENSQKDENQNTMSQKQVLAYNSNGNIVRISNSEKVAIIDGMENYIIVDTDKALLICPKDNDQLIKDYVLSLKTLKKGEKYF